MRVVFFTINMSQIGGVERVLANISNYIVKNHNYQVDLVSIFSNSERKNILFDIDNRVNTIFLKKKIVNKSGILGIVQQPIIYAKYIEDYLKENECDIAICTNTILNSAISIIRNRLKCKVIGWEHSTHKQYSTLRKLINILTYKKLDKLVVLTEGDAIFYKKFMKNVLVIPNANSFVSKEKSTLLEKNIIACGRLTSVKGFDMLIDSFNLIANEYVDWSVNIIGDGEERNKLLKQINRLNLENRVNIIPFSKNIKEFYLNSSIYALPSRDESFGMVLLEARECGLPCVAFESFGPKAIINNNIDGFIVKNGDINGFSDSLKKLMDDVETRKVFSENSLKDIKKYKIENIYSFWKGIFED